MPFEHLDQSDLVILDQSRKYKSALRKKTQTSIPKSQV